jgi:tetratricopeptide (TPR) repeat protein
MRILLLLCVGVLGISAYGAPSGVDRERAFFRALELFETAKSPDDFRQSAAAFESMLADGSHNSAVYYNIGNAYVRAGDFGKAINAYRKARIFRPRDPFLEANLRHALSLAPGRLPEQPAPWWRNIVFWSDWLSYGEKFQAALAAILLAFVVACALLRWPLRAGNWIVAGLLVAALLLSVDAGIAYDAVHHPRRAVVVQETVARKGNGPSYEPAFDQPLKDGAEFTITERRGEWVFGHFEGVGDGWLRQEAIAQ